MAKYVVDIDALKECLDFTAFTKLDGRPVALLDDIKRFIDIFPKEPLDIPVLTIKGEIEDDT